MLKNVSICALAALMAVSSAGAETSNVTVKTFGIEGMSCGDWMASSMQMRDGRAFVLGYWAASNRLNRDHPRVGTYANTEDILGAVYKLCQEGTVATLADATAQTYRRFEHEGK